MKTITVQASTTYDVTIGSHILHQIGQFIRNTTKAETICLVTDNNVGSLYREIVTQSISDAGLRLCSISFPAGETSKNPENYLLLLQTLAREALTRSDCIVALGGGVVGDLVGFAAATYLRGIPYIQIPTTLLAMVDSSVGGKTGIDLEIGKNLVGAFHQPAAVICDTDVLATLPMDVFRNGCAEVIKYGVLYDAELFSHLEKNSLAFDQEFVISRCIELKRNAVEIDEFDQGPRKLLNLGHTIGHAIEKCSGYGISHGNAVAAGLAIVCRASNCIDTKRIVSLLEQFGLPTTTHFSSLELKNAALSDKKRQGGSIDLIIPYTIGDCRIVPTSVNALQAFIEKGL